MQQFIYCEKDQLFLNLNYVETIGIDEFFNENSPEEARIYATTTHGDYFSLGSFKTADDAKAQLFSWLTKKGEFTPFPGG